MRKFTILFISLLVLLFVLVACSKKTENDQNGGADVQPSKQVKDEGEYNIFPFTGLETTDDVSYRAVAVMVSNQKQARPQTGLSKADIVFEMLTEGNITRYMAIFHSTPPKAVGPVRSAREYFFTLADNYDALYVFSGAANFVNDMIVERGIEHFQGDSYSGNGPLFIREDFRVTPHNLYLQLDAIDDEAQKKGYDIEATYEPLPFLEEDSEMDGEDANYAKIDYYGGTPIVEFKYDESTQKYTQYMNQEQTVELENEVPIEIDNVFIVEAYHEVIDKQQRRYIDIDSGGKGYLLQRGKVQYVEWENRDGRIIPVQDGQVVPFVPGQTWISFVQTEPEPGVIEQVFIGNE